MPNYMSTKPMHLLDKRKINIDVKNTHRSGTCRDIISIQQLIKENVLNISIAPPPLCSGQEAKMKKNVTLDGHVTDR